MMTSSAVALQLIQLIERALHAVRHEHGSRVPWLQVLANPLAVRHVVAASLR